MFDPVTVFMLVVCFKSFIIGSDFSFLSWHKYGDKYRKWYFSRETWREYNDKISKEGG